jgi:hypothetical protein
MAYFLGRDVDVYITTETNNGVYVNTTSSAIVASTSAATGESQFAGILASGTGSDTIRAADITGVDLSIGAVDEDITYFGLRSITKAEIKKETTLTLTRKQSNNIWDSVYNGGGRWGASGQSFWEGLEEPNPTTGYRVHVVLKSGSEVFTVRNACIQGHTKTLNADGTNEETMEFMSYVTPKVSGSAVTGATSATEV